MKICDLIGDYKKKNKTKENKNLDTHYNIQVETCIWK